MDPKNENPNKRRNLSRWQISRARRMAHRTDLRSRFRYLVRASTGITAASGLLWRGAKVVGLPEADHIARQFGLVYAEQLVKALAR